MADQNPFDYPGLEELAKHLAEVLAMQDAEGWHTFSMNIKTTPDGDPVWVDDLRLVAMEEAVVGLPVSPAVQSAG